MLTLAKSGVLDNVRHVLKLRRFYSSRYLLAKFTTFNHLLQILNLTHLNI